jgi:hypothetical protein
VDDLSFPLSPLHLLAWDQNGSATKNHDDKIVIRYRNGSAIVEVWVVGKVGEVLKVDDRRWDLVKVGQLGSEGNAI